MIKLSLTRLAVAVGGLAVSLAAGAGVASATPDLGPAVNTTCSYPQLVSALNAQGPEAGAAFQSIASAAGRFASVPRLGAGSAAADGRRDGERASVCAVHGNGRTGFPHLQQLLTGLGASSSTSRPVLMPSLG